MTLFQVEMGALALVAAGVVAPIVKPALDKAKVLGGRLLGSVAGLFLKTVSADNGLAEAIIGYLRKTGRRAPALSPRVYTAEREHVRSLGKAAWILFRHDDVTSDAYLWKRRPIWFRGPGTTTNNQTTNSFPNAFTFFRGTLDFEELAREALLAADVVTEAVSEKKGGRFAVHQMTGTAGRMSISKGGEEEQPSSPGRGAAPNFNDLLGAVPIGYDVEDLGYPASARALERLFLPKNMEEMVQEIRFWRESKDWFEDRGVPYRRGYLLHGEPGTGKTSCVRAIGEELDMPIYSINLASMNDRDLEQAWGRACSNAPSIVLFEDVDSVFHGRENVTGIAGGVTFGCLLNCLDGVKQGNGELVFVTTNQLETVDKALYEAPPLDEEERRRKMPSRPSRIDRIYEVRGPGRDGMLKLANRIMKDAKLAAKMVDEGEAAGDTPAQLQERCVRQALGMMFGRAP